VSNFFALLNNKFFAGKMNEDIFSKVLPHEHLDEYLKSSARQDKREFNEHRPTMVEIYKLDKDLVSMMINMGGTIVQCFLKLNRITEQIAGNRKGFELVTIRLKFSERQNYGDQEFDKATFKYTLTNFVKKNYSFEDFFEKDSDSEKHQLSFDFIIFTNQGNEQEALFYSGLVSLYKLLSNFFPLTQISDANNPEIFKQTPLYMPISYQLIFKNCTPSPNKNFLDLVVDPLKSEEDASNSVKIFFI
jgi:hypothetical protein